MPDPARVAQAMAVEIPVTVQGSQTAEGTGRELFTESAKTILTFENGAVLKLQSRLTPGQSIFLRNEQSGREAVCRVVETPAEGQVGHTELEFIAPNLEFWGVRSEKLDSEAPPPAPGEEQPARKPNVPTPDQDTLAMMRQSGALAAAQKPSPNAFARQREDLVPLHEMAPAPASPAPPSTPADKAPVDETRVPTGEEIDAALRKIAAAFPTQKSDPATAENQSHDEGADAKNLAALIALDANRSKRAQVQKSIPTQRTESAGTAPQKGPALDVEGKTSEPEITLPEPSLQERLTALVEKSTTGKGLVVSEIALALVILAALGFIWRAIEPLFSSGTQRAGAGSMKAPVASSPTHTAQPAISVPAGVKPILPGAASNSDNLNTRPAVGAPTRAPLTAPTITAPKLAAAIGNLPKPVISQRPAADIPNNAAPIQNPIDQAKQSNARPTAASGIVPAKIIWEVQPGFPSWAKELEVDGAVRLDATIDEHGNVAQTRIISGPRALQHSAQQAVMLWLFEPAQQNGQPVPSHMTLTVVFQR